MLVRNGSDTASGGDRRLPGLPGRRFTDLHPHADWPLLSAALADAGVVATSVAWGNEEVDWGQFDLVVVNST